jgi:hypothetical protein
MNESILIELNAAEELKSEISKLLESGATESEIELVIPELGRQYDRSASDIRRLFRAIEAETDRDEDRDLRDREINNLLEISQKDIDCSLD